MKARSLIAAAASAALAFALLFALVARGHVDLAALGQKLAHVRPLHFLGLVLATALHVLLAGEKWRAVEERLTGREHLPHRLCFAFSALGAALGQFLPLQVATAATRSLGSRLFTGSGALRSALATFFEQGFDVLAIGLAGLASVYCLWAGKLAYWPVAACLAAALGWSLCSPALAFAGACVEWLERSRVGRLPRIKALAGIIARSRLLEGALARRLLTISMARFLVLCLMADLTTRASGIEVSTLRLAASLPLVVLATAVAITPAGIGVNEWSLAASLTAFGADFETATQWALMNRVLVAMASVLVGGMGAVLAFASKASGRFDAAPSAQDPADLPGSVPRSVPQDNFVI